MDISYIKDKGRTLHFPALDPKKIKLQSQEEFNKKAKQDYFGASPNIFVGRFGYPNINVGILNTEEYRQNDEPLLWSRENYSIPKIIDLRTQLVNAQFKANIKSINNPSNNSSTNKFLELSQELSLSQKPVDIEINLSKKPNFSLTLNREEAPHGCNIELRKAQITENIKVPTKVDKIVSDTDVKAVAALQELYTAGFDEHYLTKIVSTGNLGVKTQRKLVPTRWSITLTDDTIGKTLIKQIKDYNQLDCYKAYFGGHLGNYYLILFFPNEWQYELFETIISEKTSFATDYEDYYGRKEYASSTVGGYYAARLAILEKLQQTKKQASILTLRFVDPNEYIAPLGVWVVREATRKAVAAQPIEFEDKQTMLNYTLAFIKKRFNYDCSLQLKQSILLDNLKKQKKLFEF
ncbi:hypothetical protein J4232_00150 [Candidatus Woesearchaeota archaeon]|nr:hypothetical protein [Candidatus Woesearchaeota archaeon]